MDFAVKNLKRFPEIFVERDFLTTRDDIVYRVIKVDETTYKVLLEHPVFGKTMEIFELDPGDGTLCLKSAFPSEMQSEEEMEVVLDYYNNFLLEGENTYMDYYNKEVGYFILSRNVGIHPTSTQDVE